MASYAMKVSDVSQSSPVLTKGKIQLTSDVSVFYAIGVDPIAVVGKTSILRAGQKETLILPSDGYRIALIQVKEPGRVSIVEQHGGASSSCSA